MPLGLMEPTPVATAKLEEAAATTSDESESSTSHTDSSSADGEHSDGKVSELEAIDDICKGVVYATLAVTDNKKRTLKKVSKANPWHEQALKLVTGGSITLAHAPLEQILSASLGLQLDRNLNIQGMTPGGQFLDTQGYIAHNDESIVLAYRCTTSAFDWLTNFNTTSSAWEVEEDSEQGYSGMCSGFSGWCCNPDGYQPRVHTGFYNNFLSSIPDIKKFVDPFLGPDQPPRKLFVVGHSLGAGIATLAGCYFATEYDWNTLPQTLVNVTAGAPRACCTSMKEFMDAKRAYIVPRKCRLYRVKRGRDVVANVPPKSFGFRHLVDAVKLENGQIYWDKASRATNATNQEHRDESTLHDDLNSLAVVSDNIEYWARTDDHDGRYKRFVSKIPTSLRDHMPDFYLKPLMQARGINEANQLCYKPSLMKTKDGRKVYAPPKELPTEVQTEIVPDPDEAFTETDSEDDNTRSFFRRSFLRKKKSKKDSNKRSWFKKFGKSKGNDQLAGQLPARKELRLPREPELRRTGVPLRG